LFKARKKGVDASIGVLFPGHGLPGHPDCFCSAPLNSRSPGRGWRRQDRAGGGDKEGVPSLDGRQVGNLTALPERHDIGIAEVKSGDPVNKRPEANPHSKSFQGRGIVGVLVFWSVAVIGSGAACRKSII
jgi:hypothetical protein